jgi:hypothetical protein
MENIVSREAYDIGETSYWKRVAIVVGILTAVLGGPLFGLIFCALFPLLFSAIIGAPSFTLGFEIMALMSLLFGVSFGVSFYRSFPISFQTALKEITDKIYDGNPDVIGEIPKDNPTHRMPCIWIERYGIFVFGALYICNENMIFVPNPRNLYCDQPIIMPLNTLEISVVEPPINRFKRLLMDKPSRLLEISWSNDKARFIVPEIEQTLMRVRQIVDRKLLEQRGTQEGLDDVYWTPLEKVLRD